MRTIFQLALVFFGALFLAACTTATGNNPTGKNREAARKNPVIQTGKPGIGKTRAQSGVGVNKMLPEYIRREGSGSKQRNVITIRGDGGGLLTDYAYRVNAIARRGDMVEISGNCDSACTLYLAMPRNQLCITPGATFRFHRPYGSSAEISRKAANYMMRSYPRWVRSWINRNGGLKVGLKAMSFSYASRHVRVCKPAGNDNLKSAVRKIPGIRSRAI